MSEPIPPPDNAPDDTSMLLAGGLLAVASAARAAGPLVRAEPFGVEPTIALVAALGIGFAITAHLLRRWRRPAEYDARPF